MISFYINEGIICTMLYMYTFYNTQYLNQNQILRIQKDIVKLILTNRKISTFFNLKCKRKTSTNQRTFILYFSQTVYQTSNTFADA